jgi:hypothetical protein
MGIRAGKPLIGLIAFLLALPSFGQDETRGGEREEGPLKVPDSLAKEPDPERVLLVPYEPNRYNNELEKEMKEETGLRLRQIRKRLRFGLDNSLLDELSEDRKVISYMRENDPDRNFELKYLYRGLAYEYQPVPSEDLERFEEAEKEEEKSGLSKLFSSSDEEAEEDTGAGRSVMSEGQIKDRPDQRVRYMDTRIRQGQLLEHLSRKYGAGYIVFINQLDLRPRKNEPGKLASGENDNLIKVHYSILDHEGRKVHGGAAFVSYPSRVKDLNGLIKGYFPEAAAQVGKSLEKGSK